jgi:hypothetical protein
MNWKEYLDDVEMREELFMGIRPSDAKNLRERVQELTRALNNLLKKQAVTIFIEDETHVADFFKEAHEILSKPAPEGE